MKAPLLLATALCGALTAPQAATLIHNTIQGPVTGTDVRYTVALPDDYSPESGPYPVVYHLHGMGGSEQGHQTVSVPDAFEAARSKGLIGPVIVVFPNGYGNSFWADDKNFAKPAETNLIRELIPHIEATYAARTDRDGRFIQGFSMGGFGAAKCMAKFPELFRAATLYDGALLTWQELKTKHPAIARDMFGNDPVYFAGYSPFDLAAKNAGTMGADYPVKMAAGSLLSHNRGFRDHLVANGLAPEYSETGCGHELPCLLRSEGEAAAAMYGSLLQTPPDDHQPLPGLMVTGDPRSTGGATWTYKADREGVAYDLQGILFYPRTGNGPFGGVVVSHGKGGSANVYSTSIAKTMREWGLVVVATNYVHAVGVPLGAPGKTGEDGASQANILRGRLAMDILRSLPEVDLSRIAAHGHSMGAFLTGALVGTTSGFRAASHTAGGVSPKDGFAATSKAQAAGITAPYLMQHGDIDNTVPLSHDRRLDSVLAANGVTHDLIVYPGVGHPDIATKAVMLDEVKSWYTDHGVLGGTPAPKRSSQDAQDGKGMANQGPGAAGSERIRQGAVGSLGGGIRYQGKDALGRLR